MIDSPITGTNTICLTVGVVALVGAGSVGFFSTAGVAAGVGAASGVVGAGAEAGAAADTVPVFDVSITYKSLPTLI